MADLNALVIFAKVVEASSFSEAARRLQMPVSTVSRRIAELEHQLGVRLLERSTRSLRLTDTGADILGHARRTAAVNDAIEGIVSNTLSEVSGTVRLSAPPSISDTLLVPIVQAFQAAYPDVRVQIFVTQRMVDPIADGVDLMLRVGDLGDSSLVARRLLRYRHQLVASPAYLEDAGYPAHPRDLLGHRLIAFSPGGRERKWRFAHARDGKTFALSFAPHIAINDYAGVAAALLASGGIGDLPPIVRVELVRDGRLVEVMGQWRLPVNDLSIVSLGNRQVARPVRLFQGFRGPHGIDAVSNAGGDRYRAVITRFSELSNRPERGQMGVLHRPPEGAYRVSAPGSRRLQTACTATIAAHKQAAAGAAHKLSARGTAVSTGTGATRMRPGRVAPPRCCERPRGWCRRRDPAGPTAGAPRGRHRA